MNGLPNFESIVELYEPLIKKFLTKYHLLTEFDEYRQIAWIALWEAYSLYDPKKGAFPAYASAMIRGHLLTEIKRRKQYCDRYTLTEHIQDGAVTTEGEPPVLDIPLSALSDRERQWFKAAILEGLSTKDIADYYGVSQDTVRSWKKSAVKKLKQQWGGIREKHYQ